jgi:hypothetical protein
MLSEADRSVLEHRARCSSASQGEVVGAKVVLLADDGVANSVVAERLDVGVEGVSRWRKRFCQGGVAALADRPRTGGLDSSRPRW